VADFDPDSLLDTPPPASATMTIRPKLSPAMQDILNQVIAPGESAGAYNVIYGGKKIDDLSHHPDIPVPIKSGPNAGDVSTAAGKYQFINSTWKEAEKALGLKDFGPDSQDAAAAWLAKKTYAEKTGGRDIEADYASGDPSLKAGIRRALASQWESLDKAAPRSQLMTVGNDRYRFNDDLFKDDNVHLMSPEDYLALAPPMEDTPAAAKQWRDLRASVGAGEPIFKAPTLNIAADGSTGTVTAQDGRNRALLAQESGLDAIPVKINQTGDGTPSRFVGMTGNVVPAHDIAPANTAGMENQTSLGGAVTLR
jgi:muramidase (phage lysozyme)